MFIKPQYPEGIVCLEKALSAKVYELDQAAAVTPHAAAAPGAGAHA
jgi:hypothetical protein